MVRAVRFAALLGFEIESATYEALLEHRDKVALASPARMYEEVQKLFLKGEGEKTFQMLRHTGMFGVLFPHLNAWIDTEADGFPHIWVGKALEWADTRVQAGTKIEPHLLFSLMFGQYLEEKSRRLRESGMAPLEALDKSVAEFLGEVVPRVQIPRRAALAIRDILWNQGRFEKMQGKAPLYFLRRPGFQDAFEYLQFSSELTGARRELLAWWREFIKAHPVQPGEAVPAPERKTAPLQAKRPGKPGEGKRPDDGGKRRRRRPRRRGPRPGTPKP
jgi:poly(A) polymerase